MKLGEKHSKYFKRFAVIIVTGGSSGIGCSIIKAVRRLAPDSVLCNLSRSKPDIFFKANDHHFSVDLINLGARARAISDLALLIQGAPDGEILLVNNSGFGDYGCTQDLNASKHLDMIDLNIKAVVDLSMGLLPLLLERGGCITTIASTASFQPTPFLATYGATKAFVRNWSLALNEDLRGTGVHSVAICPGPTQSNFFKAAGFSQPPMNREGPFTLDMTADEVAAHTLDAITRKQALRVTGWKNWWIAFFGSKMPIVAVNRIGAAILRKLRLEQHK